MTPGCRLGISRGRLRAVLSCGLLISVTGCTSSGPTPLSASLQALWPSESGAIQQAREIPYASLSARLGDIQGLLVMGAEAGNSTLWPSNQGAVLELNDGGLHALTGLEQELLGSEYGGPSPWRQDTPYRFELVRHWQDAEGFLLRGEAEGEMRCTAMLMEPLPLGERRLERCEVSLNWAEGASTKAIWWRDPESRDLWAVKETPWPQGPSLSWRVARHWW